jgi:hypothetical protein
MSCLDKLTCATQTVLPVELLGGSCGLRALEFEKSHARMGNEAGAWSVAMKKWQSDSKQRS